MRLAHLDRCEDAYYHNHGTSDLKPTIQSVLLVHKNTLGMEFDALGAMVAELCVVEVGLPVVGSGPPGPS